MPIKKRKKVSNKWELKGYFVGNQKNQMGILLPDFCENCGDKPINEMKRFETFVIKKIEFYANK